MLMQQEGHPACTKLGVGMLMQQEGHPACTKLGVGMLMLAI